ncbi:MAG: hypothetical protein NC112_07270 [Oxalobacter formigenes]|nr:hypothetical protein [Oxalobacter formigenes]
MPLFSVVFVGQACQNNGCLAEKTAESGGAIFLFFSIKLLKCIEIKCEEKAVFVG